LKKKYGWPVKGSEDDNWIKCGLVAIEECFGQDLKYRVWVDDIDRSSLWNYARIHKEPKNRLLNNKELRQLLVDNPNMWVREIGSSDDDWFNSFSFDKFFAEIKNLEWSNDFNTVNDFYTEVE